MEGQVPIGWNSGWFDACLVPSGEVGLHIHDTVVQHPHVCGGDSVRVVECGRSPTQVFALELYDLQSVFYNLICMSFYLFCVFLVILYLEGSKALEFQIMR